MSQGEQDAVQEVLAHRELLSLVYQPIVHLERGELVGYEALVRLPGEGTPQGWLAEAASLGAGVDLELLVLERAVERLPAVPASRFLSVNLSLDAVADARTAELVSRGGADASRLVLELTETLPLEDSATLLAALQPLRRHGVRIAVHVGLSEQALHVVEGLKPDVVKVRSSGSGAGGVDDSVATARLAETIDRLGRESGAAVVVTVLEGEADLQTAHGLHAPLAQGYVLGRPDVVMTELSPKVRALLGAAPAASSAELLATVPRRRQPPMPVEAPRQVVGVFDAGSLVGVLEGLNRK